MYIYKRRSSYVQADKPAAPLACLHRKRNLQKEKMQKDSKIVKKKNDKDLGNGSDHDCSK